MISIGRRRRHATFVRLDKKLLATGGLILLLLVAVKFDKFLELAVTLQGPITFADGQPVRLSNEFEQERGYIWYRIAGSGERYTYAKIATRYRVPWPSIDKLNESQYTQFQIKVGSDIKVPINP